jgi:hypothetical protein
MMTFGSGSSRGYGRGSGGGAGGRALPEDLLQRALSSVIIYMCTWFLNAHLPFEKNTIFYKSSLWGACFSLALTCLSHSFLSCVCALCSSIGRSRAPHAGPFAQALLVRPHVRGLGGARCA